MKRVLTFFDDGGIISKLLREKTAKKLEIIQVEQQLTGRFVKFAESFDRSVSLLKKISKNFEKSA